MRQIVQNYRSGALYLEHVPTPLCRPGSVLVRTAFSLVSSGTERMKVDQARMNLIAKACSRPDKVRQVVESIRSTGLRETIQKVRERLGALTPLGYSLAGVVEEVGAGVDNLRIGDRVACAGEGVAMHAEFVSVPRNLCVRIADTISMQDAAFSTVGAIALNGVRQGGVGLGDCVVVIGLGLVGLLAVQVLKAAGCKVIGIDVDAQKLELARQCGADIAVARQDAGVEAVVLEVTNGVGADAAYIAASTRSADPLDLAGKILRDRGRVIIVGMVPVHADWQTYYSKELSVVMSRSYGPGRHDPAYEQKGVDYPIGYVRWTEGRNMEEFLRLVESGAVSPSRLGPSVFKFADAPIAYRELHESPGRHAVGMLFEYSSSAPIQRKITLPRTYLNGQLSAGPVGIGLIGAGHFATATLIPALKKAPNARLISVCSAGGLSAASVARRHAFENSSTDYRALLTDPQIDAVVIATRHDTHARFVCEALEAGKHVFVEKPLALCHDQLEAVIAARAGCAKLVMPGFNRRFSPLSAAVKNHFAGRNTPLEIVCRVNAGKVGGESWYEDPEQGGWRIISEGCHFVDLIQYICGCQPVRVFTEMIGGRTPGAQNANCSTVMRMMDGSTASLVYVANGDPSIGKERIEVFGQNKSAVIDNWKTAYLVAGGKTRRIRGRGKGHVEEMAAFFHAIRSASEVALPFEDAVSATVATFAISESMVTQQPVTCRRREQIACGPRNEATLLANSIDPICEISQTGQPEDRSLGRP
ncbi:MAG: bi-domain-containing oxidoreductase [Phycisphaerae bacterium]|nr:bi-domain-containing oxidoreductase [Phycisphaerae bacterium]